ncbi:MAG: glycoside hydrolase family 88 protein [Deltaproteobacteria bacterium]|nr:glycoside hydrolase family 88 protein [Deltaproteobacteria bacterium]
MALGLVVVAGCATGDGEAGLAALEVPTLEAPIHAAPSEIAAEDVLADARRVNDAFMARFPDPTVSVRDGKRVAGNGWARAVYFEGLMALHAASPSDRYLAYARTWAERHAWGLVSGPATRFADDQCAGQTYLELDALDPDPSHVREIEASVGAMSASAGAGDWTWVDAIHMAMPVFARIGSARGDDRVLEKMYALYTHSRDVQGGGLYSRADHLWWRDAHFVPPYATPSGRPCFWSRGNGWVYSGLARAIEALPEGAPHRAEYVADFVAMSDAIRRTRRPDGFWNASLADPEHFGGKETTGTALFVHGMAWGVRKGLLAAEVYRPFVLESSRALASVVRADGSLAWVQGEAAQPSDRQPVRYDTVLDQDDFAVGCFLLAESELARMLRGR